MLWTNEPLWKQNLLIERFIRGFIKGYISGFKDGLIYSLNECFENTPEEILSGEKYIFSEKDKSEFIYGLKDSLFKELF